MEEQGYNPELEYEIRESINSLLIGMVGQLAKALEEIQKVVQMQLDHAPEHHKFFCPTCDGIDNALRDLVRE